MAGDRAKRGDAQRRREDILRAASALLDARGYDGFNMREIARGAGVSAGTLYSYFETKEHIFATLAANEFARLTSRIQAEARDAEAGFVDLLVGLMPEFFHFHKNFGMHFSSWVKSKRAVDAEQTEAFMEAFALRYHEMMRCLEDALRKSAERDGKVMDPSPLCMRLIWSALIGLADEYAHKRNISHDYEPAELTQYTARALSSALLR